jgi:hypothetical protein
MSWSSFAISSNCLLIISTDRLNYIKINNYCN